MSVRYLWLLLIFCSFFLSSATVRSYPQQLVKLKEGDKAPDFTVTNPEGEEIKLSDLRGKMVLLDFWASWCVPCRMANPDLIEIYDTFSEEEFEIFQISLDIKKESWLKAIEKDGLHWPYHGSELSGWDSKIAEDYGIEGIPAQFLIDENGVIISAYIDPYDVEEKLRYIYYEQVNMYPKLACEKLFFSDKTKYEILDSTGNRMMKKKDTQADISALPPGEYLVKFEDKEEKIRKASAKPPEITFFPERVDSLINLSREAGYEIYNLRGRLEKEGREKTIDASLLPKGAYYLNLEGAIYKVFKK